MSTTALTVGYSDRARRDLTNLHAAAEVAEERIGHLATEPWIGIRLHGRKRTRLAYRFSLPTGGYRATYTVQPEYGTCIVEAVLSREGCYRHLRRRFG